MRKGFLVSALAALVFAAATGAATNPLQATACSSTGKDVTIGGKAATVYCGPAKATVHVGGRTMTFRNGSCSWTSNSFKLQLGTIFLFRSRPLQQQAGFAIYATGVPVARALVDIYWKGTYYYATTLHATALPNGNQTGGTFQGKLGSKGTGPSVSGTISCV